MPFLFANSGIDAAFRIQKRVATPELGCHLFPADKLPVVF